MGGKTSGSFCQNGAASSRQGNSSTSDRSLKEKLSQDLDRNPFDVDQAIINKLLNEQEQQDLQNWEADYNSDHDHEYDLWVSERLELPDAPYSSDLDRAMEVLDYDEFKEEFEANKEAAENKAREIFSKAPARHLGREDQKREYQLPDPILEGQQNRLTVERKYSDDGVISSAQAGGPDGGIIVRAAMS